MKLHSKILGLVFVAFSALSQATDIFQAIKEGDRSAVLSWLGTCPDLDVRNDKGRTVLMQAALCQNEELVKLFLTAGSDKYAVDFNYKTAKELALYAEAEVDRIKNIRNVVMVVGAIVAFAGFVCLIAANSSNSGNSNNISAPKNNRSVHHHYHNYSSDSLVLPKLPPMRISSLL